MRPFAGFGSFMEVVWDVVKAEVVARWPFYLWAYVIVYLLTPRLWPAAVVWALLGAYLWGALRFTRAFEQDREAGEIQAALARLGLRRPTRQTAVDWAKEFGRSIAEMHSMMTKAAISLAAWAENAVLEATVHEARWKAEAVGMNPAAVDVVLDEARESAYVSTESTLEVFKRLWAIEWEAFLRGDPSMVPGHQFPPHQRRKMDTPKVRPKGLR